MLLSKDNERLQQGWASPPASQGFGHGQQQRAELWGWLSWELTAPLGKAPKEPPWQGHGSSFSWRQAPAQPTLCSPGSTWIFKPVSTGFLKAEHVGKEQQLPLGVLGLPEGTELASRRVGMLCGPFLGIPNPSRAQLWDSQEKGRSLELPSPGREGGVGILVGIP